MFFLFGCFCVLMSRLTTLTFKFSKLHFFIYAMYDYITLYHNSDSCLFVCLSRPHLSHVLHTLGSLGSREQLSPIRMLKSSRTAELCRVGMVLKGRRSRDFTVDICYICDWLMEQATVTNLSFKPLLFNHTVENILQLEFYTRCFVFALLLLTLHSLEDGKIH